MTSEKTNINKKTVHIDQKVLKNVKKSQKTAKKRDILKVSEKKVYTERQLCEVAGMFFRCEMQMAALTAIVGLYFAEKADKHALLKEYMRIDRFMHKFSSDCHAKIEELTGALVVDNNKAE